MYISCIVFWKFVIMLNIPHQTRWSIFFGLFSGNFVLEQSTSFYGDIENLLQLHLQIGDFSESAKKDLYGRDFLDTKNKSLTLSGYIYCK